MRQIRRNILFTVVGICKHGFTYSISMQKCINLNIKIGTFLVIFDTFLPYYDYILNPLR